MSLTCPTITTLIEYKKFAVVKYFTFGERKKHTIKA
jgi:hypothetical protein